ncbi:MAG: electron transport complex subunit RsxC [Xanthomonadales bacterium]|nr:electron transport complex subunit RsxC [Xanthomonadales bacterium]
MSDFNNDIGQQLHRFHGGLQLRHYKQISCTESPPFIAVPKQLVVPLQQHAGLIAEPCVEVGQRVLRGQRIASAQSGISAHLHAPSSGTVSAIEARWVHHELRCQAVIIDCDGLDEAVALTPLNGWTQSAPESVVSHLQAMGVVGLGGAVFPSAQKIHQSLHQEQNIHTVILNGAECEPYLSCDESLMLSRPEEVIRGAQILCHAAQAQQVIIAIEDRMTEVEKRLLQCIKTKNLSHIQVVQVPTYYPEGGERQLIQVLTGEEVPSGGYPQDLGLVCFNVATAQASFKAVEHGEPLIQRLVTVTGQSVQHPGNWWARLGTPVDDLLRAAGGLQQAVDRIVMGGPIMGRCLIDTQAPVVKASNCILALSNAEVHDPQGELPCINCGFCVRVCPARLLPQELHWAVRSQQLDRARDYGLMDCIECGCCDQVCPSHIALVEDYRLGKHQLRVQQQEQQRAQLAKQRYEARQERLQQHEAALAARRQVRKSPASKPLDAKARIAAALAKKRQQKAAQQATNTTPPTSSDEDRS